MADFYTVGLEERAQRMGQLALEALKSWGVTDSIPELIKIRENAIFRVSLADGSYAALRIHRYGYHSDTALKSELQWMRSVQQDGINVPAIVPTLSGALFITATVNQVPEPRQIDMVEWLPGAPLGSLEEGLSSEVSENISKTFTAVGRLVAQLHNHATTWQKPKGFIRHAWDIDGLTGKEPRWGRFWEFPSLNKSQCELMKSSRDLARRHLIAIGQPPESYGLIHADFNMDNLLQHNGQVMAIDFDDCGAGWHLFDLSTLSILFRGTDGFDQIIGAIVDGYRQERPLSDEILKLMPLFYLLRAFTYLGWVHTRSETQTAKEIAPEVITVTCDLAEEYLQTNR